MEPFDEYSAPGGGPGQLSDQTQDLSATGHERMPPVHWPGPLGVEASTQAVFSQWAFSVSSCCAGLRSVIRSGSWRREGIVVPGGLRHCLCNAWPWVFILNAQAASGHPSVGRTGPTLRHNSPGCTI